MLLGPCWLRFLAATSNPTILTIQAEMNLMKKLIVAAGLAAVASSLPTFALAQAKPAASPHTFTGNVGFVSDYRYRGRGGAGMGKRGARDRAAGGQPATGRRGVADHRPSRVPSIEARG